MQYSALTWFQGLIRFFGHTHSYTHVTCTQFLCVSYDGKMEIAVIHFRVSSAVLFHLHQQSASATGRYIRFACNIFTRYITRCAHTHTHTQQVHAQTAHAEHQHHMRIVHVCFSIHSGKSVFKPIWYREQHSEKKNAIFLVHVAEWKSSTNENNSCMPTWMTIIYIHCTCLLYPDIYIHICKNGGFVCVCALNAILKYGDRIAKGVYIKPLVCCSLWHPHREYIRWRRFVLWLSLHIPFADNKIYHRSSFVRQPRHRHNEIKDECEMEKKVKILNDDETE